MMAKYVNMETAVIVNTAWRNDEPSRITLSDWSVTVEQPVVGYFPDGTPLMGLRSWNGGFEISDDDVYVAFVDTLARPVRWFLVATSGVGEILPTALYERRVEFVGRGSFE